MSLQNITRTLDTLDALYHEQINSFDQEGLPDLETQSADRNAVLARLKTMVEAMLQDLGDPQILENRPDLEKVIDHIRLLVHQNSALKNRVVEAREHLQQSMSRITAGKRAITAYGSPQSVRSRPKVLTVRN